jgi:hypothetical protein
MSFLPKKADPFESSRIRRELKLRQTKEGWEVYTTIHGSGVFRWFRLSESESDWYIRNFPEIQIVTNESEKES